MIRKLLPLNTLSLYAFALSPAREHYPFPAHKSKKLIMQE
jgi:hypothetical protein